MKIITKYLLISMFITFVIVYITQSKPKVILKYPKLSDDVSNMYVDDNNICYRYHKKEIDCPLKTL